VPLPLPRGTPLPLSLPEPLPPTTVSTGASAEAIPTTARLAAGLEAGVWVVVARLSLAATGVGLTTGPG
jgi:hypothetical protein